MTTTSISDYITTETVMKAFAGASDLTKAGTQATMDYYKWEAMSDIIATALGLSVVFLALIVFGALAYHYAKQVQKYTNENFYTERREAEKGFDFFLSATMATLTLFVVLFFISLTIISDELPIIMNPAGKIINDALTQHNTQVW